MKRLKPRACFPFTFLKKGLYVSGSIRQVKACFWRVTMDQKDLEYFRTLLNGQLEEALKQGDMTLEEMTDNTEIFADPADRATMESDRAFTLRIRDRERKLIKKIRGALTRLDNGTYGICDECGEDIGVPRLKARPVTKLCINCKSKQEEDEQLRGD